MPGARPVTPEQMELARLRAELAKTEMGLDIVKKAATYFAKQSTLSTLSSIDTAAFGRYRSYANNWRSGPAATTGTGIAGDVGFIRVSRVVGSVTMPC